MYAGVGKLILNDWEYEIETDAPAFGRERTMAKLSVGDPSPEATLDDIDGATVEFPAVKSFAFRLHRYGRLR